MSRDKPDAMLEEDFAELQRASELLEAERLRHLAEIERRGIHRRDGHLSAASWLATTFKVGWGQAKAELRTARGLDQMPETAKALESGDVSLAAARLLVAAREIDPEAFSRCEPELVDAARQHQVRDLSVSRPSGGRWSSGTGAWTAIRRCGRCAASTPRGRSAGWSGWTATSTRRRERPC